MRYRRILLFTVALVMLCMMPVMGVTTYLDSKPDMSATISGVNEFSAGQDATINVIVQNSGVSTMKFVTTGTIDREDIPSTAKMVMVGMLPGAAPVVIKSDPRQVGDLLSQAQVTVPVLVKILSNASEGEYQVPLTVTYTYLASSDQPASDVLQSTYQQTSVTFPLTIRIKPEVKIEILKAVPEGLNIGTEGYIDLGIKNIGFEDGKKATVKIIRNGASPVIPVDSSVYVGDFPRDAAVSCRYKVAVSGDAEQQTYPVDVAVTYENRDGDVVTSTLETVGIPVGGKIIFNVISSPAQISPGSTGTVQIQYKNNGDATAYSAQVRISAVGPFTSSDDTAYLGDLKPGDTANARYQMSVDNAAVPGNYTLDTQIRYRDTLDNSQVSDTFKVPVTVIPPPASGGIIPLLIAAGAVILVGVGAGYYLLVMRKKM
jgi:hypothetical protein